MVGSIERNEMTRTVRSAELQLIEQHNDFVASGANMQDLPWDRILAAAGGVRILQHCATSADCDLLGRSSVEKGVGDSLTNFVISYWRLLSAQSNAPSRPALTSATLSSIAMTETGVEEGESMPKFGTSGLRGLVTELNGPPASSYTFAFLKTLAARGQLAPGDRVCVGRDLRSSSPAISSLVQSSIAAAGYQPVECGAVPTPALSLYSIGRGYPAIMVTGSHIPDDRNGLKFYRADGEIDKADEAAMIANHDPSNAVPPGPAASEMAKPLDGYIARYVDFFGADALKGMKVGVYQHSSVFRDVIMSILAGLGAEPTALGRSDVFVPVDTEAVDESDVRRLEEWAHAHEFAAIVSSDGDADRPLVSDEKGEVVRGDVLGALTAAYVNAGSIVTPMTSNSAIEDVAPGAVVVRTAVGSPFVISGIEQALKGQGGVVIGFEANGGVILGSSATKDGRVLAALPTRDAVLPILACLALVQERSKPLSTLVAEQNFRPARSSRLKEVAQERSGPFLAALPVRLLPDIEAQIGRVTTIGSSDGVRLLSERKEMIYFRASGNAPELRCYVEAPNETRADELLAWGLAFAERHLPSA